MHPNTPEKKDYKQWNSSTNWNSDGKVTTKTSKYTYTMRDGPKQEFIVI